jgi:hypothetical protein
MCSYPDNPMLADDKVSSRLTRAGFLAAATAFSASLLLPQPAAASLDQGYPNARVLWVVSAGTRKVVKVPFTLDGTNLYEPGYFALCQALDDFHVASQEGDVEIDVRLIEGLYEVQQVHLLAGIDRPIIIHSGYRTARTNSEVGGVFNSYHLRAMAADFNIDGVPLAYTRNVCLSRPIIGGVGYYPGDTHMHIDCRGYRAYWEG